MGLLICWVCPSLSLYLTPSFLFMFLCVFPSSSCETPLTTRQVTFLSASLDLICVYSDCLDVLTGLYLLVLMLRSVLSVQGWGSLETWVVFGGCIFLVLWNALLGSSANRRLSTQMILLFHVSETPLTMSFTPSLYYLGIANFAMYMCRNCSFSNEVFDY